MRRLSICLYTPSVDPSGMGAHMVDLAAELTAVADVSVMAWATPGGAGVVERAARAGARPLPLPAPRTSAFLPRVAAYLDEHRPDVFHVHVGTGRENWGAAALARRTGVTAVVQTLHLPWLLGSHKHRAPFFDSIAAVDRLITVSERQRRTYERIGVPRHLLQTVPNGIRPRGAGPGRRAARQALGLTATQPVVLTVGRLLVQKGQRHLVDAVPLLRERFPDVAAVILGQGQLHQALRLQAEQLGVSDVVHLPGHRPDARMLLDAADVFALPSRQEGMPLAAIEAMDAGLPVVASDVIGTSEVVADGDTGTLVRRGDADALAAGIGELLADERLREQYGAAGRRRFSDCFTSDLMAARTLAVYRDVLATRRLERTA